MHQQFGETVDNMLRILYSNRDNIDAQISDHYMKEIRESEISMIKSAACVHSKSIKEVSHRRKIAQLETIAIHAISQYASIDTEIFKKLFTCKIKEIIFKNIFGSNRDRLLQQMRILCTTQYNNIVTLRVFIIDRIKIHMRRAPFIFSPSPVPDIHMALQHAFAINNQSTDVLANAWGIPYASLKAILDDVFEKFIVCHDAALLIIFNDGTITADEVSRRHARLMGAKEKFEMFKEQIAIRISNLSVSLQQHIADIRINPATHQIFLSSDAINVLKNMMIKDYVDWADHMNLICIVAFDEIMQILDLSFL